MLWGNIAKLVKQSSSLFQHQPIRNFDIQLMTSWLMKSFNQYDTERVKEVGKNRACAEWLLKNGAHVMFEGTEHRVTDFNKLASGVFDKYGIREIYADDSSISHDGFKYLEGQENTLEKITLIKCKYIQDDALKYFADKMTNLKVFNIQNCYLVSADGLKYMSNRKSLEKYSIHETFQNVDIDKLKEYLTSRLPNCKVTCTLIQSHL